MSSFYRAGQPAIRREEITTEDACYWTREVSDYEGGKLFHTPWTSKDTYFINLHRRRLTDEKKPAPGFRRQTQRLRQYVMGTRAAIHVLPAVSAEANGKQSS